MKVSKLSILTAVVLSVVTVAFGIGQAEAEHGGGRPRAPAAPHPKAAAPKRSAPPRGEGAGESKCWGGQDRPKEKGPKRTNQDKPQREKGGRAQEGREESPQGRDEEKGSRSRQEGRQEFPGGRRGPREHRSTARRGPEAPRGRS